MNLKRINTWATVLVTTVLVALAIGAFSLSFDVLKKEAMEYGVASEMAWVFAASIDLSIIGCSFFVIWASINKKVWLVRLGYFVILLITLFSVFLNMNHAEGFDIENIASTFKILPVLYMVAPPILLATMTLLAERMIEVVLSDIDAEDLRDVTVKNLQSKLKAMEDTLSDTVNKYEVRLREEQSKLEVQIGRLQQLQSDYDRVADTVKLLPYLRNEVFLLAKVAANMISMDEAYRQQDIYNHKTGFINFASKVMISGDDNV